MNSRTGTFLRGGRRRILAMDRAGNCEKVQWRVCPVDFWRTNDKQISQSLYLK
jgi:hypothetical protein